MPTPMPHDSTSEDATLRERWLRLLRDLYAVPDRPGADAALPDTALTRILFAARDEEAAWSRGQRVSFTAGGPRQVVS